MLLLTFVGNLHEIVVRLFQKIRTVFPFHYFPYAVDVTEKRIVMIMVLAFDRRGAVLRRPMRAVVPIPDESVRADRTIYDIVTQLIFSRRVIMKSGDHAHPFVPGGFRTEPHYRVSRFVLNITVLIVYRVCRISDLVVPITEKGIRKKLLVVFQPIHFPGVSQLPRFFFL